MCRFWMETGAALFFFPAIPRHYDYIGYGSVGAVFIRFFALPANTVTHKS